MQIRTVLLPAAILVASFSQAIAATPASSGRDDFVPPVPIVVVPPIRAPAGYENSTIPLEFVVDAHGRPHHIDILCLVPTEVRELIVSAVEQWKFRPATRAGNPVTVRVILPLTLAVKPSR